jgi:hypothetical protein
MKVRNNVNVHLKEKAQQRGLGSQTQNSDQLVNSHQQTRGNSSQAEWVLASTNKHGEIQAKPNEY